jgi:hypothetical protein
MFWRPVEVSGFHFPEEHHIRCLILYWKSSVHTLRFIFGMVKVVVKSLKWDMSDVLIFMCSTKVFSASFLDAGPNPHLGHLAWADAFVITADSISMLSEACSTGKPVYVVGTEHCRWKFSDFHNRLHERGAVRPFTGLEDVSSLNIHV